MFTKMLFHRNKLYAFKGRFPDGAEFCRKFKIVSKRKFATTRTEKERVELGLLNGYSLPVTRITLKT